MNDLAAKIMGGVIAMRMNHEHASRRCYPIYRSFQAVPDREDMPVIRYAVGDIIIRDGEPWVCRGTSFRPLLDLGHDPWNRPVKMTWWQRLAWWCWTHRRHGYWFAYAAALAAWSIWCWAKTGK
jgi:hypothetical protein